MIACLVNFACTGFDLEIFNPSRLSVPACPRMLSSENNKIKSVVVKVSTENVECECSGLRARL